MAQDRNSARRRSFCPDETRSAIVCSKRPNSVLSNPNVTDDAFCGRPFVNSWGTNYSTFSTIIASDGGTQTVRDRLLGRRYDNSATFDCIFHISSEEYVPRQAITPSAQNISSGQQPPAVML